MWLPQQGKLALAGSSVTHRRGPGSGWRRSSRCSAWISRAGRPVSEQRGRPAHGQPPQPLRCLPAGSSGVQREERARGSEAPGQLGSRPIDCEVMHKRQSEAARPGGHASAHMAAHVFPCSVGLRRAAGAAGLAGGPVLVCMEGRRPDVTRRNATGPCKFAWAGCALSLKNSRALCSRLAVADQQSP